MWLDRIVELWQDTLWDQLDPLLLFSRELQLCFVKFRVPIRLAAKACIRFRGANVFENLFVTGQRLSGPIAADLRKQAVLNRIPFGSASGKMRYYYCQSKFVRHLLQTILPSPAAIAIRIAAITFKEEFILVRIMPSADPQPPSSDRGNSKLRRLVRSSNNNDPLLASHVVDSEGNRHADGIAGVVILQHLLRSLSPSAASFLEVPNQFAFLRINADYGLASVEKTATHSCDIAHLSVTLRILFFSQALSIDANRIADFPQQPSDCDKTDFEPAALQPFLDRTQSFARPFDSGD